MKLILQIVFAALLIELFVQGSVQASEQLSPRSQLEFEQTNQGQIVLSSSGIGAWIGNIFNYFTWCTTQLLCTIYGWLLIILTADRGQSYTTCMIGFQTAYEMN